MREEDWKSRIRREPTRKGSEEGESMVNMTMRTWIMGKNNIDRMKIMIIDSFYINIKLLITTMHNSYLLILSE
jgi:hypothetical protein